MTPWQRWQRYWRANERFLGAVSMEVIVMTGVIATGGPVWAALGLGVLTYLIVRLA